MEKKRKKPSAKALEKLQTFEAESAKIWSVDHRPTGTDALVIYKVNPEKQERPQRDADDL